VSVLSLPAPTAPVTATTFARGSRRLGLPGRPVERATLAHHLAVLPIPARTLALVTGNAPDALPADGILVRWVATRIRSLSASLLAGEPSVPAFRQEAGGLLALGPDPAPAGEEMLVGLVAAALRLAAGRLLPEPAVSALQASLAGIAGTGGLGPAAWALEDASRGGFPAPVAALVELLGDVEAEDGALKESAVRMTSGGGRPGADPLAGIVAVVREVALGPL
jgi:hypothetical protein